MTLTWHHHSLFLSLLYIGSIDLCCASDLSEVEVSSLVEEKLPLYTLRAETAATFTGNQNLVRVQVSLTNLPSESRTLRSFSISIGVVFQVRLNHSRHESISVIFSGTQKDNRNLRSCLSSWCWISVRWMQKKNKISNFSKWLDVLVLIKQVFCTSNQVRSSHSPWDWNGVWKTSLSFSLHVSVISPRKTWY